MTFISSGSFQTAILERNAQGRLAHTLLDGYFHRIDYCFFPAGGPNRCFEFRPGLFVHELTPPCFVFLRWVQRFLAWAWGVVRIRRLARGSNVVGAGDPFVSGVIASVIARTLRLPSYISLVSNYEISRVHAGTRALAFLPGRLNSAIERFTLRRADLVLVDTDHYKEYAIGRGASPHRVKVVPRIADPGYYQQSAAEGIWDRLGIPGGPVVLYVGRFSPEKYPLDCVDVLAHLHEGGAQSHLLMLGDGQMREAIEARSAARGVKDFVHIRSGIDQKGLFSAMASASVVLATHAGYALLEAALAGAAVIAYDFEWHSEIILPGETGFLVPYRDTDAMAAATKRLLDSPALASDLRRNLREFALERHDLARATQIQRSHLEDLINA